MDDSVQPRVNWRDVAEAVPGAVAVQADGEFVHVSAAFATALGTDSDRLTGAFWRTPFDDEAAARLEREAFDAVRSDGRWEGDLRVDGGDAPPVEAELSAAGSGAIVWIVDEHATAPETGGSESGRDASTASDYDPRPLPDSAFLRRVLDVLDDVVYVIDGEGRSHLWNEALVETTGYSHEEIEAMHPMELVPADQHEYVPGLLEAIESTEDRRVEVDVLTADGERIPHEFRGTSFEDPVTGEHFRCGVARDVTERRERERELERYESIVETVEDGVYALDEDLRFTFVNEGMCELTGRSREALLGTPVTELFVYDDEARVAGEIRRRVVERDTSTGTIQGTLPREDGERRLEARYRLSPDPDGEYRGSVGVVRDVTDRWERERELEHQRDELATLDGINELLLETVRELIRTNSREAVERTVCERLTDSALYEFAWVGERALDGDGIVPRVTAGDDRGYLDAVTVTTDGSGTDVGPVARAMGTGEVQVASVGDPSFGRWREAARERGFESVAAGPLQHDGTVYGVLAVYSDGERAFSPRERAGFDALGRTVGVVIHAARSRELLFADAVVELEFRASGAGSSLGRAAAALDCSLALDGYVPAGERWVLYLSVTGGDPASVVDALDGDPEVERARVLRAEDADARVELVITESSLLHAVTDAGATLRTATFDPDDVRLVVEAPVDADVRDIVERVVGTFQDAELLSRRDRDRGVTTVGRPGGVLETLTDRQHEALEAAYRAGYFEWPRESTAEEVAESLDLTAPTLHGHLRKAEAAVLSAILDTGEWD